MKEEKVLNVLVCVENKETLMPKSIIRNEPLSNCIL